LQTVFFQGCEVQGRGAPLILNEDNEERKKGTNSCAAEGGLDRDESLTEVRERRGQWVEVCAHMGVGKPTKGRVNARRSALEKITSSQRKVEVTKLQIERRGLHYAGRLGENGVFGGMTGREYRKNRVQAIKLCWEGWGKGGSGIPVWDEGENVEGGGHSPVKGGLRRVGRGFKIKR